MPVGRFLSLPEGCCCEHYTRPLATPSMEHACGRIGRGSRSSGRRGQSRLPPCLAEAAIQRKGGGGASLQDVCTGPHVEKPGGYRRRRKRRTCSQPMSFLPLAVTAPPEVSKLGAVARFKRVCGGDLQTARAPVVASPDRRDCRRRCATGPLTSAARCVEGAIGNLSQTPCVCGWAAWLILVVGIGRREGRKKKATSELTFGAVARRL